MVGENSFPGDAVQQKMLAASLSEDLDLSSRDSGERSSYRAVDASSAAVDKPNNVVGLSCILRDLDKNDDADVQYGECAAPLKNEQERAILNLSSHDHMILSRHSNLSSQFIDIDVESDDDDDDEFAAEDVESLEVVAVECDEEEIVSYTELSYTESSIAELSAIHNGGIE